MDNHSEEDRKGCVFTWKIENFLWNAYEKCRKLYSSHFKIFTDDSTSEWQLEMYPSKDNETIACHLLYRHWNQLNWESIGIGLSCVTADGKWNEVIVQSGPMSCVSWTWKNLLENRSLYFPNDSFTVRCRIWEKTPNVQSLVDYNALTHIEVTKISYHKSFSGISALCSHSTINCFPLPGYKLEISLCKNSKYFSVKFTNEEIVRGCVRLYCELTIYSKGVPLDVIESESLLSKSVNFFEVKLPYSTEELTSLFPDDTLPLHFKFILSGGQEYSQISEMKKIQSIENFEKCAADSMTNKLKIPYLEGKFTDVKLKSGEQIFKAHRIILSAGSPVFAAMFDSDMAERKSGIINIDDIDAAVLDKMLFFLYTNTVTDIEQEMAMKLLYASDKYQVEALKKEVETVIKNFITADNVCEILFLADSYNAESLKQTAQEYICKHHQDLFSHNKWKQLIIEHGILASEVLQKLSLRYSKC